MLSSAHVLAMDAKNLLDVVDSLRKRYPELFAANASPQQHVPADKIQTPIAPVNRFQFDQPAPPPNNQPNANFADENYQVMTRQTYQNAPAAAADPQPATAFDANTELYSNQPLSPQCGIYDNECVISQQMQSLSTVDEAADRGQQHRTPPKPPVAVKPSNLQQKLKRGQLPLPKDIIAAVDTHGLDEPLRIVEDDMVGDQADGMQLYSNTMTPAQLPEPVSCSIVQENVFQKAVVSSHTKG